MTDCLHMTTAEYAAHRGVSDSYVRRLRRTGRVVTCPHGEINANATDVLLADALDPLRGGDRTEVDAAAPTLIVPAAPAGGSPPSVHEAVRRERLARARLAELELGEVTRELTRRRDVERAVVTLVRQAIERFRLSSSRLRTRLAAASEPRQCEALLDEELELICKDLQKDANKLIAKLAGEAAAES